MKRLAEWQKLPFWPHQYLEHPWTWPSLDECSSAWPRYFSTSGVLSNTWKWRERSSKRGFVAWYAHGTCGLVAYRPY